MIRRYDSPISGNAYKARFCVRFLGKGEEWRDRFEQRREAGTGCPAPAIDAWLERVRAQPGHVPMSVP